LVGKIQITKRSVINEIKITNEKVRGRAVIYEDSIFIDKIRELEYH